jgi:hypothetical protein
MMTRKRWFRWTLLVLLVAWTAAVWAMPDRKPVAADTTYTYTLTTTHATESRTLELGYGEVLVLYGPNGAVLFEQVAGE